MKKIILHIILSEITPILCATILVYMFTYFFNTEIKLPNLSFFEWFVFVFIVRNVIFFLTVKIPLND